MRLHLSSLRGCGYQSASSTPGSSSFLPVPPSKAIPGAYPSVLSELPGCRSPSHSTVTAQSPRAVLALGCLFLVVRIWLWK